MRIIAVFLLAAACGDHRASSNVAVDTVKYVESGATCESLFTSNELHAARCTLPNGAKIYCTAGSSWKCDQLSGPKSDVPKPPASGDVPKPPASPVPAPQQ
jgi:hypothetical protein